jgi:DNA polymerase I
MSKLVLIDGNAILHRAYHALPPLTTRAGEPINAVYGLVSMLLKVIQDLKPTHIVVCFDRKEPTFRQKEFKDYQAQRPPTEENLSSQFGKAKEVLSAMNVPIYEMAGYEADDLIGTIAEQSTEISKSEFLISKKIPNSKSQIPKINEVIIVTGDRDILQLVDDDRKIRVYLPVRGLSDAKLMKSDDVVEKLGVKPELIVDYKALVGDPSDNYKGVPGIGPKTAIGLLDEFGGFRQIYDWIDEVWNGKERTPRKAQAQRGKLKEQKVQKALKDKGISIQVFQKLVDGKTSGEMSYKLAQIITDVDLKTDLDKSRSWQVDNQRVLDLFDEFGFRTLKGRVKEVGKSIVSENQGSLF